VITPTIVGQRLWTWMWGLMGALLAVPLSIIRFVVVNHLFPSEDVRLPA